MSEPKYLVGEDLLIELMASAAMAGLTTKNAPKDTYINFHGAEKRAQEILNAGPVQPLDMSDEAMRPVFESQWLNPFYVEKDGDDVYEIDCVKIEWDAWRCCLKYLREQMKARGL